MMGWQGKDPSTDFRGGGFTSLKNLLYFAGNYSVRLMLVLAPVACIISGFALFEAFAFDVLTRSIKYQFHGKTETPQLKAGDTSNNSQIDEVKMWKSEDLLKERFSRKNTKENKRQRRLMSYPRLNRCFWF